MRAKKTQLVLQLLQEELLFGENKDEQLRFVFFFFVVGFVTFQTSLLKFIAAFLSNLSTMAHLIKTPHQHEHRIEIQAEQANGEEMVPGGDLNELEHVQLLGVVDSPDHARHQGIVCKISRINGLRELCHGRQYRVVWCHLPANRASWKYECELDGCRGVIYKYLHESAAARRRNNQ